LAKLYAAHDTFVRWLEQILMAKYGRRKSDRAISREAGLDEQTLNRITTRCQKPSDETAKILADHLGIPVATFRRHAGLDPLATADIEYTKDFTPEEVEETLKILNDMMKTVLQAQKKKNVGDV
jgi:lambda repressor-like predicted transcriptional regulator